MTHTKNLPEKSLKEFLEKCPAGSQAHINDLSQHVLDKHGIKFRTFQFPKLELHCTHSACNGTRFFSAISCEPELIKDPELPTRDHITREHIITYVCNNCQETLKIFALQVLPDKLGPSGTLTKIGEHPAFGAPIPARVITLIGGERDYYIKGYRAEKQGLGIAAFAYYRRVVENQKNRIFDEIIRVAQKIGAPQELISELNAAKTETQFKKAVEKVKHALPQDLLINTHNPLTLLHSALSEGMHSQPDEHCLEIAASIRLVLTELAEKLAHALKEEAELKAAVAKLLKKP